jgi:alkaline phosphatase D
MVRGRDCSAPLVHLERQPDAHGRAAINLAYAFDGDGDGDALTFHEFVRGPLNAVKNPAKTKVELDPSADPTVLYTEGGFFNFVYFSIGKQADGRVHLIADALGDDGQARPLSIVDLTPAN